MAITREYLPDYISLNDNRYSFSEAEGFEGAFEPSTETAQYGSENFMRIGSPAGTKFVEDDPDRYAAFARYILHGIPEGSTINSARLLGVADTTNPELPDLVYVGALSIVNTFTNTFLQAFQERYNVRFKFTDGLLIEGFSFYTEPFDTAAASLGANKASSGVGIQHQLRPASFGDPNVTLADLFALKIEQESTAVGSEPNWILPSVPRREGVYGFGTMLVMPNPPGNGTLGSVNVDVVRDINFAGPGNCWVEVWDQDPAETAGSPVNMLAKSDVRTISSMSNTPTNTFTFSGADQISLSAGQKLNFIVSHDTTVISGGSRCNVFLHRGTTWTSTEGWATIYGSFTGFTYGNAVLFKGDLPFILDRNTNDIAIFQSSSLITGTISLGGWTAGVEFEIPLDGTNDSQAGGGIIQNYVNGVGQEKYDGTIGICIMPFGGAIAPMNHVRTIRRRRPILGRDGLRLEITYEEPRRYVFFGGI